MSLKQRIRTIERDLDELRIQVALQEISKRSLAQFISRVTGGTMEELMLHLEEPDSRLVRNLAELQGMTAEEYVMVGLKALIDTDLECFEQSRIKTEVS